MPLRVYFRPLRVDMGLKKLMSGPLYNFFPNVGILYKLTVLVQFLVAILDLRFIFVGVGGGTYFLMLNHLSYPRY